MKLKTRTKPPFSGAGSTMQIDAFRGYWDGRGFPKSARFTAVGRPFGDDCERTVELHFKRSDVRRLRDHLTKILEATP